MIHLPSPNCINTCTIATACIPTCLPACIPAYVPTHPTRYLRGTNGPSVVYQATTDLPVYSTDIPCYDSKLPIKCNCTFEEENDKIFDDYIRLVFKFVFI